jgi:tRNA pseudouridine38-40 synthase
MVDKYRHYYYSPDFYLCKKMQRYFLKLAYKGTAFHGWQIQPNAHSVQAELCRAASLLLQSETEITGCGRTDTGVHATEFYAHFDSENLLADCVDFVYRLNAILPFDIAVSEVFPVQADAHARFSALSRTYEYRITSKKNPFVKELACHFSRPLDLKVMNHLASVLMEYCDFSCFSKAHTQTKTNNCTISRAAWEEKNDLLIFTITADRFLRNMVRAIVGTLVEAGLGNLDEAGLREILKSGDRSNAGKSMPAEGLFLTKVEYPKDIFI